MFKGQQGRRYHERKLKKALAGEGPVEAYGDTSKVNFHWKLRFCAGVNGENEYGLSSRAELPNSKQPVIGLCPRSKESIEHRFGFLI